MPYLIAFLFLLPFALLAFVIRVVPHIARSRRIVEKAFVCPNCGEKFKVTWPSVYFKSSTFDLNPVIRLKCPACGKVDMCRHERE